MLNISKIVIKVKPDFLRPAYLAQPVSFQTQWSVKLKKLDTDVVTHVTMAMASVTEVEITYSTGTVKIKSLLNKERSKAWDYIKRLVSRKAYQEFKTHGGDVSKVDLPFSNKGVGGRYKWQVKYSDVYHHSMADVVEKYRHLHNAVVITSDSWFNEKLQEVFASGRKNKGEEKTTLK